jgi:hypothetical protein
MLIKQISLLLFVLSPYSLLANSDLMSGLTDMVNQAETKKTEDKKVLNYAFKQRMRTQWIARDALLISMNFHPNFYQKEIIKNANLFDENFHKLIKSKKDIERAKQEDSNFTRKINDINRTWEKFYSSVKEISNNRKDQKALNYIETHNIQLLNNIAYIFTNFIKSYQSKDKLEASMAHIKSMLYTQVGKPRMYINKLVKERLLIENNIHKEENQKNLKESIIHMDKLMLALKDGDKELELNGTEDRKMLEKLLVSQKIWEEVKKLVKEKVLTPTLLTSLIQKNNAFITAHTQVVTLTRSSNDN